MKLVTKTETNTYVTGVVLTGEEFKDILKNAVNWFDIPLLGTDWAEYSVDLDYDNVLVGEVTIDFGQDSDGELPKVISKPAAKPATKKPVAKKTKARK